MARKKVDLKPTESYCLKCGRMLPIESFYLSTNPNHATGVQPYCKACANELANIYLKKHKSMEAAIYFTCADMGQPFVRKLFDACMGRLKNVRATSSYWGNYASGLQMKKTNAEKEAWKGFDCTDVDFKDIANIQKAEKHIEDEMKELRYRWGQDKDVEQLQYLESRWAEYVTDIDLDVAQEQLYRNLCLAELDIWQGNEVDKAMKRQIELMKNLGIDKFEAKKGKTLTEQMIENDIFLMENEEPAEYYKDKGMYQDFRGIHRAWIKELKRPIINLITGSKEYNIEKEDKEEWENRNEDVLNDES